MSLAPEISLDDLPRVRFVELAALPPISAIYFALGESRRVLYVGATKNLYVRWRHHEKLSTLKEYGCVYVAWEGCDLSELRQREGVMIRSFQPLCNNSDANLWASHRRSREPVNPSIGARVYRLRIARNILQKELARHIGASIGVLSRIEQGHQTLTAERLSALARLLGVSADYLLGLEDAMGKAIAPEEALRG